MMPYKKFLPLLVFLLPGAACALAQNAAPGLQWEETTLKIETEGGSELQNVTFRFRNTGSQPVRILSATASCGCTVPVTDRNICAPGEDGTLRVAHKPKPGPGARAYRINVRTDEGGARLHVLTLQVANSPRVTLQPRVLKWAKDEARSAKQIDVSLKPGKSLNVTGARAQPEVLDIAVTGRPETGRQTLVVTPKPGTGFVSGRVRVQLTTDPPLAPSMDTQFFAVLR